jgi:hypothetical protein
MEQDAKDLLRAAGTKAFEHAASTLTGGLALTEPRDSIASPNQWDVADDDIVGLRVFDDLTGNRGGRGTVVFPKLPLYIIDEPERHLHPEAQLQAAEWLAKVASPTTTVLIASHAPAFLDMPAEKSELIAVLNDSDGNAVTQSLTADLLHRLDALADELGVDRSAILLVTRSFLIVEGVTDRKIINHFYGADLRRERVEIIPVHGTRRAKALPEAELLQRLNKPVAILFDNTTEPTSDERRVMEDIAARWPADAPPLTDVRFDAVDILRALPDELFSRALASWNINWPGWSELERRFNGANEPSLKTYMLKTLKIQSREDELVDAVIAEAPPEPLLASPLYPAVQVVLATARPTRIGDAR